LKRYDIEITNHNMRRVKENLINWKDYVARKETIGGESL